MTKKILVTGGAGFIGSHLVDDLIKQKGHEVTIVDTLEEQVHGKLKQPPNYLNKDAKFYRSSVTDSKTLEDLVRDTDNIFHLAGKVGVGQSMYKIKEYIKDNILGLGNLLDILVNSTHNVKKVILASSNTVYGEGKSVCDKCGIVFPELRTISQLKRQIWDLKCPNCGLSLNPLLTGENSSLNPSSIYAYTKLAQEKIGLMIANTYGIKMSVLRFFLVYGPRQALSNPYTGVCSIFCTRALNGKPPIIFEDGKQTRDFVNVRDVCHALVLAMEKAEANGEIYNVGTGVPMTIAEVADIITNKINPNLKPIYNLNYRIGDIRHCVADISKIKEKLGFSPMVSFREGIDNLINWVKSKKKDIKKPSDIAIQELKEKGLLK